MNNENITARLSDSCELIDRIMDEGLSWLAPVSLALSNSFPWNLQNERKSGARTFSACKIYESLHDNLIKQFSLY